MPHTKSAVRHAKSSAIRRDANRAVKSSLATMRKKFFAAVETGDKAKCEELYRKFASELDKASKAGVIARNNAIRRKTRAAAKVARLTA